MRSVKQVYREGFIAGLAFGLWLGTLATLGVQAVT